MNGTVSFIADPEGVIAVPTEPEKIAVEASKPTIVSWALKLPPEKGTVKVTVTARLTWRGTSVTLTESRKVNYQLVWTAEP
jgi:hypothetical protein